MTILLTTKRSYTYPTSCWSDNLHCSVKFLWFGWNPEWPPGSSQHPKGMVIKVWHYYCISSLWKLWVRSNLVNSVVTLFTGLSPSKNTLENGAENCIGRFTNTISNRYWHYDFLIKKKNYNSIVAIAELIVLTIMQY